MAGRQVSLRVGGQTYRVATSAGDEELHRLVAVVEEKLQQVAPGTRGATPQGLLLAAIALAHDVEEERKRADSIALRARDACGRILHRVEAVLGPAPVVEARRAAAPVAEAKDEPTRAPSP